MRALRVAALVLLALAVAGALALVFMAQECTVSENGPGEPRNLPTCEYAPSPVGLFITALLALAAALAWAGKTWAAWPPWLLATGTTVLFGLSHGTLLYPCLVAAAGLLLDKLASRRRTPAA